MASGSESLKENPTDPESESLKQKPTDPGSESPKQKPTDPGSESPKQKPIGSGSESPKQNPTGPGPESPEQKPTGSGSESPKKNPTGSGSESPKQKPTGSGSESPKQKPTGSGSESPKKNATGSGSESPKQKPTGSGAQSLKRKPIGLGADHPFRNYLGLGIERKPTGPRGSGSLNRMPRGPPGSGSLNRMPRGSPGSGSPNRMPRGPPGSGSQNRMPRGSPGSGSPNRMPRGPPGSGSLNRMPRGPPGSGSQNRMPRGPPGSGSLNRMPRGPPGSGSQNRMPRGSPGSGSPNRMPRGPPGSGSLNRMPRGPPGSGSPNRMPRGPPGSGSLNRMPRGPPGSGSLNRMPRGPPGSGSLNRMPRGPPGSGSLKRKPTGTGSEPRKRQPTGPQNYNDDVWKFTKGTVDKKLEKSEPYRIFMSPISCDPGTHTEESTLSFAELLDKSLGDLTESLHLNFMVELGWLFAQYFITDQKGKKMTLLYERCNEDIDELHKQKKLLNVRHKKIINKNAFGHQHSKLSMFAYADGSLRVVVMSTNLCEDDWTKYAQGIWVSPKFPLKEEDDKSDGNSKTDFKIDILRYLNSFREPILVPWIQKIEKVDFSQANVFFIPSVPGKHTEPLWGHVYLKNILKKHAYLPCAEPSDWPIIAQCSSLGSLGTTDEEWLKSEFIESLSASTYCGDTDNKPIPFNLIFPSVNNVLNSWDGALGGICLPYNKVLHEKQLWLKKYMCLWQCHSRRRTKAVPHIKTYCRMSASLTHMSWFYLGSANLSKAAWGRKLKSDEQSNFIMAHEAGVLFLPKFLIGSDTFPIDDNLLNEFPYFSLPFDLPLSEYSDTDQPWTISTK